MPTFVGDEAHRGVIIHGINSVLEANLSFFYFYGKRTMTFMTYFKGPCEVLIRPVSQATPQLESPHCQQVGPITAGLLEIVPGARTATEFA